MEGFFLPPIIPYVRLESVTNRQTAWNTTTDMEKTNRPPKRGYTQKLLKSIRRNTYLFHHA